MFVAVTLATHSPDNSKRFRRLIDGLEEVQEAYAMTGAADYLVKLVVPDLKALARILNEVFLPHASIAHVHSSIVLDRLKQTSSLPLGHIPAPTGNRCRFCAGDARSVRHDGSRGRQDGVPPSVATVGGAQCVQDLPVSPGIDQPHPVIGDRNLNNAVHAARAEGERDRAIELVGDEIADHTGAVSRLGRGNHRRPASFKPFKLQLRRHARVRQPLPTHTHPAARRRQRPVSGGV